MPVDHLLNKGCVKSIEYFQNLGMNSKDLLMITDIMQYQMILKMKERWLNFNM